ncbi:hypothetical protein DL98DRAFT_624114 [Cadophora sp. DSE1049]|nr:hypothetical protein DL98DRAFT_624114 [Cadophora sp. DSE1049]
MDSSFSSDPTVQTESESEYSGSSSNESVDYSPPKPPCTKRSDARERLVGLFGLGLSGQDVWDQMIPIINRAAEEAGRSAEWEEATRAYDENNDLSANAWDNDEIVVVNGKIEKGKVNLEKQQAARDEVLLRKRYDLIRKAIGEELLPEQYVKLSFIRKDGKFAPQWAANKEKGKEKILGKTYSSRVDDRVTPNTVRVDIMVYERTDISLNLPRMRNYTGTLLHEIAHALFGLWACNCDECEEEDVTTEGVPDSGHGPAWMDISLALERMMGRVFGYRCWLGRSAALAVEGETIDYDYTRQQLAAFQVNRRIYRKYRFLWSCNLVFAEDLDDISRANEDGLETDDEEQSEDEGEGDEING